MTFTAYIERQKSLIRSRHETEEIAFEEERIIDSDTLFKELSAFKGLNTTERQQYSQILVLS